MDMISTIVGVGLVALLFIPIFYLNLKKKNKRNKLMADFLALGIQKGASITDKEVWRDSIIGIDVNQKTVLYERKNENEQVVEFIQMNDVAKCEQLTISSSSETSKGEQKVIQRLELKFIFKAKDRDDLLLTFYDAETSLQLDNDIQRISDWHSKIVKMIHK